MKLNKLCINFLCLFIPSKRIRDLIRDGNIKNYLTIKKQYKKTKTQKDFPEYLSIVAIAKDEGAYFKEWLEYHLLVGVEKFYIYDNESTDNTKEILEPYIKKGIVEYTYCKGEQIQRKVYKEAIAKYKNHTKWLAVIDLDEFIVPLEQKTISAFLQQFDNQNISQILIGWVVYGSAHHKTKPEGLVIENFKYHEKEPKAKYWHKAILNPRSVWHAECHASATFGKTIDADGNKIQIPTTKPQDKFTVSANYKFSNQKIQINHYAVKSYEEFVKKAQKGDALKGRNVIRDQKYFECYDQNDVYCNIMDQYTAKIKAAIKKS